MELSFRNKVALVTGAGSGIGRATALAFAQSGAKVLAADNAAANGEETVALIRRAGGEALFTPVDVSRANEVAAMVNTAIKTWGRLDCAFNNAGIEGQSAATAECSEETWDRVIGVNLKGVWLCMKFELPAMLKQGGGAIVNMASVAGLVGFAGSAAYCASKGGVIQVSRAAALDYARQNIRVNVVCPGVIDTPMISRVTGGQPEFLKGLTALEPMGRLGTPDEVAAAVLWLCSDAASFVTGHPLVVDGGLVAQ